MPQKPIFPPGTPSASSPSFSQFLPLFHQQILPRKLVARTWKSPLWTGKSSSKPSILRNFHGHSFKGLFFFPPRHVVQSYNSSTLAPCAVRRAGAVVLCPDRSSRCNDPRRPWCHRCHGDAVVIPRHSFGRPSRCPTNRKMEGVETVEGRWLPG